MRFRKLRIAWSVMCGVASLLLIALWLRSYNYLDVARGPLPGTRAIQLSSSNGRLRLFEFSSPTAVRWSRSSLHQWQLNQALEQDPQLQMLQEKLQYLLLLKETKSDAIPSRRYSQLQRQIEQMNLQIENYRTQARQQLSRNYGVAIWTKPASRYGFDFCSTAEGIALEVPHWFVVVLSGAFAAILGIRWRWRFSLRTLLVATTLVAVVLGVVVYAVRR